MIFDRLDRWLDGHRQALRPVAATPNQPFATKRALSDAIRADIDVAFTLPDGTTKRVSELRDGEVLAFVGPTSSKIRYAGRVTVQVFGPARQYSVI